MGRKRRVYCRILTLITYIICFYGCSDISDTDITDVDIRVCLNTINTKADMPDEDKISDISLMIFDGNGLLEKHLYLTDGQTSCTVGLLKNSCYSICACSNFGSEAKVSNIKNLADIIFHMTYPDEYREGMPMASQIKKVTVTDDSPINLELERLMAKISLRMDRAHLSEGVSMNVTDVRIGNCPKVVRPFIQSRAENADECFIVGFSHDDLDCAALNNIVSGCMSETISLYMLENMQGNFSPDPISHDYQKVLGENDIRKDICSYIELKLDYSYDDIASTKSPLIYRFYLGENLNSLDIKRNCHYHITVSPEDDGLHGDGWRVDKSGLNFIGEPKLTQYPSDYIRGNVGDKIHIGCLLTPSYTPFDVGKEYLEADKANGIYDYEIDADGHGVTITLTGPGTGLIYMEAGDPINDAALFLIEVNL